jgi:tetratricopeptide (TPR) repeat protein
VPTDTWALCNEGLALLSIRELHSDRHDNGAALEYFGQARNSFERMLAITPDDGDALANMGRLFCREGEALQAIRPHEAITKFQQAIAAADTVFDDAAEDAETRYDKARALHRLGQLYITMDGWMTRAKPSKALTKSIAAPSRSLRTTRSPKPEETNSPHLSPNCSTGLSLRVTES